MALPLPKTVSDVGPGGGLVTAMGGINSLANENILRQINQIKKKYTPATTEADIRSKNAYAALVGLQPAGKILGNENAFAALNDEQRNAIAKLFLNKSGLGNGNNNAPNALNQTPPSYSGTGQPSSNSFSDYVRNALKGLIGGNSQSQGSPPQNSFNQMGAPQSAPQQQQAPQQEAPQAREPQVGDAVQGEGANNEQLSAYDEWMRSPEGQAELAKGEKANIPDVEGVLAWKRAKDERQAVKALEMTLTQGQRPKTNAEKIGEFQGTKEQGKQLGKLSAKVINDIGQQQLSLSNSGANLDKLIGDLNDPKFIELRDSIPFFQSKQLKALSKIGTREQQEMIGNFIADAKSFAGSTVNSFKGQTMKREFDYADQLKPSEDDTVAVARGKITALKTLKEVAERKNDIILGLMQDQHLNLGDAVKQANKMVDLKGIDKEVRKLTAQPITDDDIATTARETGMTREQVIQRLRSEGRY